MGLGTNASFALIWIKILYTMQKFVMVNVVVIGVYFDDFIMVWHLANTNLVENVQMSI